MIRSITTAILLVMLLHSNGFAQYIISGKITTEDKKTPVPNATLHLLKAGTTTLSRADGSFAIHTSLLPDSLEISAVGFAPVTVLTEPGKADHLFITMKSTANQLQAVVVGTTKRKATSFMEKVIAAKQNNNPLRLNNFHYQRYTKNELDIGNLDFTKRRNHMLDTMLKLYKNIDADAQGRSEAAVYFDERIVNVYHSQTPRYDAENMTAKKTLGLGTDALLGKLTKFNFHFNVYDNWLPVFDQSYASPLNANAFTYYHFFEGDSTVEGSGMIQQVHFTPIHSYERTFAGDLWISKQTFAVKAVSMHLSRTADLNFVHDIQYSEDYKESIDSLTGRHMYMPSHYTSETEFESGLDLVGIPVKTSGTAMTFLFRSSSDVSAMQTNDDAAAMIKSAEKEKTTDWNQSDSYWQSARPQPLTVHEKSIYQVADTFQHNHVISRNLKLAAFGSTGFWNIGNKVALGPYSLFLSRNPVEGWRIRPGFLTLSGFDKRLNLYGYVAYGTTDKKLKGSLGAKYIWNAARWTRTTVAYGSDYDLATENDDELDDDNLISSFLRKPVPYFRTYVNQFLIKHEQYMSPDWGVSGTVLYKDLAPVFPFQYHPIDPVTDKPYSTTLANRLPVAQATVGFRYAHNEKTKVYNFDQVHIRTFSPVLTVNYTYGLELGQARFPFQKIDVGVEQMLRLPPKSLLYYKLSAGQVFGTLPYLLLDVPQGNAYYVASKYQFNTMLPYEFAADRYINLHTRLSFGGALLSKVPLLKKLQWRERISFNSFWGDMTHANLDYNKGNTFSLASRMPFIEGSVGIENIFHLLSIEYYRRLSYVSNRSQAGGVFLGVTLNF